MGRAPAVLTARARVALAVALAVPLALYYTGHTALPRTGIWGDVAIVSFPLLPAVFALVWLALPLRRERWLLAAAAALAVVAVLCTLAGLGIVANFAKLFAATFVGWWFLLWFEELWWVVLVAVCVAAVDSFSVFAPIGPTNHIIKHHVGVYTNLSVSFPITGVDQAVRLGVPDVLFFALFVGAAARFELRAGWTWLACVASFALTFVITVATHVSGLPALPLLSLAFLAANCDILLRRWRDQRAARAAAAPETD